MPRHPIPTPSVAAMPGAVFSRLAHKIAAFDGEVFPLHVGDTWMEPFEGARMQDFHVEDHPGMHRYSSPQGMPELRKALIEKLRDRNHLPVDKEGVLVGAGATGKFVVGSDVMTKKGPGTVKYRGTLKGKDGVWLGVELEDPNGLHDGRGYFECAGRLHGIFLRERSVKPSFTI